MFVGVILFSFLLGKFGETIEHFKFLLNPQEDKQQELTLFLGVLKHFNNNEHLPLKFKNQL